MFKRLVGNYKVQFLRRLLYLTMTSKRGENKEGRYEPQVSRVTDVLTTF